MRPYYRVVVELKDFAIFNLEILRENLSKCHLKALCVTTEDAEKDLIQIKMAMV
jgi:hypothetical protein